MKVFCRVMLLATVLQVWMIASAAGQGTECQMNRGVEYNGKLSVTKSGKTCFHWAALTIKRKFLDPANKFENFPEKNLVDAVNYCRNGDNWEGGIWCYIDNDGAWDACDMPFCTNETVGEVVQLGKAGGYRARQSTTALHGYPDRAIDGNRNGEWSGHSCIQTQDEFEPWWYMDMGAQKTVRSVRITNRFDCCMDRLNDYDIAIVNDPPPSTYDASKICHHQRHFFFGNLLVDCDHDVTGQYLVVKMRKQGSKRNLTLCEVEYWEQRSGKPRTEQSSRSWGGEPQKAVDGDRSQNYFTGRSCTCTLEENTPWWYADFGERQTIKSVAITNRADCCAERLSDFDVAVVDSPPPAIYESSQICIYQKSHFVGRLEASCAMPLTGRYLVVQLRKQGTVRILTLCEVEYYSFAPAYSYSQMAKQSSVGWSGDPERAVDGNTDGNYASGSCSHTLGELEPWWYINLGSTQTIRAVRIYSRKDCCVQDLNDFDVAVVNAPPPASYNRDQVCVHIKNWFVSDILTDCDNPVSGQYLVVKMKNQGLNRHLMLCEVQYFNTSQAPQARQSSVGWGGDPQKAVDGNRSPYYDQASCAHTLDELEPWWYVDLQSRLTIRAVAITNRVDCCVERFNDYVVTVVDSPPPAKYDQNNICLKRKELIWGTLRAECLAPVTGRYLAVQLVNQGNKRNFTICEVEWFTQTSGLRAYQSSITSEYGGHPEKAIDGLISGDYAEGRSCTNTNLELEPWWYLDFGISKVIKAVRITNRDDCCAARLNDLDIAVVDQPPPASFGNNICAYQKQQIVNTQTFPCARPLTGRYLVVKLRNQGSARYLDLCEVEYW